MKGRSEKAAGRRNIARYTTESALIAHDTFETVGPLCAQQKWEAVLSWEVQLPIAFIAILTVQQNLYKYTADTYLAVRQLKFISSAFHCMPNLTYLDHVWGLSERDNLYFNN